MKKIKRKLKLIQDKKQSQLPVDGLIGDVVIKAAFPNITKLVLLYSLVPQSEFVTESGFSCIQLIIINKTLNSDSESLEALTRLSQRNKFLIFSKYFRKGFKYQVEAAEMKVMSSINMKT